MFLLIEVRAKRTRYTTERIPKTKVGQIEGGGEEKKAERRKVPRTVRRVYFIYTGAVHRTRGEGEKG